MVEALIQRKLKRIDNFLSGFRSVGKYTGLGFQLSSDAKRFIKARSRTIEKYLESIEKKSYNLAKSFEGQYNTLTTSPASKDYYLDSSGDCQLNFKHQILKQEFLL